ncbi:nuclear transport factor 2 family protein [Mycobacterium aquaticum]|uniref:SnoaL-like domain-containing protein n=1 Tax=Mycobacterium aquaticum TaxID=1927124 RepID=A0A1X0A2P2_9MYCO|nr:nuclear transport factor 2 family protein [Mycobacterium aquaticum]ORA24138.1 hypothetical protein BST13_34285 [Mycobacterium aquaticum]
MADQSVIETFKAQISAVVTERDLDLFSTLISPGCVFRDIVESEPRVGRDKFREYLSGFLNDLNDIKYEYVSLFCEGEFVAAEIDVDTLYTGEGAEPGGTRVTIRYCIVDQIRDGLVQRETVYWDPEQLARQLPATTDSGGTA